jgi:tripartite-type tricarboxylate transporter receptor subunit TctC
VGALKDVPTAQEAGLPNFEVSVWHGLYGPKGTPKPVVDRLTKALQLALKDKNVIDRFGDLGTGPVEEKRATPDALATQLKSETEKWGPIIKKAGVFAD